MFYIASDNETMHPRGQKKGSDDETQCTKLPYLLRIIRDIIS